MILLGAFSCVAACGGGTDASSTASAAGAVRSISKTAVSASGNPIASSPKDPLLATLETAVAVPGARIVTVGGSADTAVQGARRYAELADVPWSGLAAGTRVMVLPGSCAGPVAMTANGSAEAPIRVEPVDPVQMPVVRNSIDVRSASYLTVTGLQVRSPMWGGFVIPQGSRQITLDRNVIMNAPIGIDITDGAGLGLVINQNLIEDSATHAISVATNAIAAQRNAITGNTLRRSGYHGIELRDSFWRVERKDVSGSGRAIPGTSGIHVYSPDPSEDSGDDNVVRYNASHANADTGASDGNGIQVDHWCDRNVVVFNLVWGNDGSGINIYEAADNVVYANTSLANNLDPGRTHGALAEIVVGASPSNNRTTRNRVFDNIALSTRANVPALYVDGRGYLNPTSPL
ncbi:MAG TPA: right-handed parallel beta-helix repeat-containing protein, partial [Variovorax sp.]|nr:right-handed parallel beta-helix repeat-containing protein [Variovorax sp.]